MVAGAELAAFVDALPKVELHLHLEGSVRPETLLQLAQRHGTFGLPTSLDALRDFYRFRDFDHFVQVYYAICDNLRTADDFALIVSQLGADLARQNVRYAEVTFTPYNHTRRGVAAEEVFGGVEVGRAAVASEHGVQLRFCVDIPGEFGPEAGVATAQMVLDHHPEGVVSFGLGGPEIGFPRARYAEAFAMARSAGLHSVPHAGETDGPEAIRQALDDLHAERIGHGVRCLEDPALVERLRDGQVPLEICPTSNARLGVVPSLSEHPLRRLLDAGLLVTLNSDDPPMFGTSLRQEYLTAVTDLGLSRQEIVQIARNGVQASFLPPAEQRTLLAQIDRVQESARSAAKHSA